jgi:hypothetical protein
MEPTVLKQITALPNMSLAKLREKWRALLGTEPPGSYGVKQMIRRLAYRVQELHYGGLSDGAKARLREIADADELTRGKRRPSRRIQSPLAAGTRLVRTWRGIDHVVTAMADGGFEHDGKRYRTLTAVARAITGQHISGPRFFGLAQTGKESK